MMKIKSVIALSFATFAVSSLSASASFAQKAPEPEKLTVLGAGSIGIFGASADVSFDKATVGQLSADLGTAGGKTIGNFRATAASSTGLMHIGPLAFEVFDVEANFTPQTARVDFPIPVINQVGAVVGSSVVDVGLINGYQQDRDNSKKYLEVGTLRTLSQGRLLDDLVLVTFSSRFTPILGLNQNVKGKFGTYSATSLKANILVGERLGLVPEMVYERRSIKGNDETEASPRRSLQLKLGAVVGM